MPKYSIVIPLHNEQENVTDLYDRLKAVMEANGESFELVLVDDGSSDESFSLLRQIAGVDSRVTVVRLRRNFGVHHRHGRRFAARSRRYTAISGKDL